MGYKVNRTIFRLKFADEKYEGLEIRCKSPAMGVFLDVSSMAGLDITKAGPEHVEKVSELFQHFVDSVLDWNLEDDDGEPIPHTVAGLRTLDFDFAMELVYAWIGAVQGTSPGLPKPSESGHESLAASIPMENLSANHPSSSVPA